MATIKDVAQMAGVSVSTVSKYINGGNVRPEHATRIAASIEALDFRVNPFARSLKTRRSHSIGVLLPDMTAPFYGTVVMAMDKILREVQPHDIAPKLPAQALDVGDVLDEVQQLIGELEFCAVRHGDECSRGKATGTGAIIRIIRSSSL